MELAVEESTIKTGGKTLFARKWSPVEPATDTNETILLFHDSLGCIDLWKDFPAKLAAGTGKAVVAYDRLGFGRSDARKVPLAPAFAEEEATGVVPVLINQMELDQIIPFGHSMGGAIAVAAAAYLPASCAALITVSALSFIEKRTVLGVQAGEAEFERPERFDRLVRYHGEKACWVLDSWVKTWLEPAFAGWNLDSELALVSSPTLILHGDQDEYGSVAQANRIGRLTTGPAKVVILEGCKHFPHREQPERVIAEVKQFLD